MNCIVTFDAITAGLSGWHIGFVDVACRGCVMLLAAFAAVACLRQASAAKRHFVWLTAFVSLLILPLVTLLAPHWQIPVLPWRAAAQGELQSGSPIELAAGGTDVLAGRNGFVPSVGSNVDRRVAQINDSRQLATIESQDGWSVARISGWGVAAAVWCTGVVLTLLPLLLGLIRRRRLELESRDVSNGLLGSLADASALQLELSVQLRVLLHRKSVMPVSWGSRRATLLLPAEAVDWTGDRLKAVMLHELGHVKRRDCIVQQLVHVVCALYWFNPLAWLAARRMKLERESACDDLVLEQGVKPADYADVLLSIAKTIRGGTPRTLAVVAMATPSTLERRVRMILDNRRSRRPLTMLVVSIGSLAAAGLLLALAVVQPVPAQDKKEKYEPTATALADIGKMKVGKHDWPQFFGWKGRNNTPEGSNIPIKWDVEEGTNIKWKAKLGSQTYGNPVVANGKVYVGTNNSAGYIARYPSKVDLGCMICFDEKTGEFLWQHSNEKLPTGRVHDWPFQGICSAPYVDGERLWYVSSRGELVCLDTEGFHDGENDGIKGEIEGTNEADVIWRFDMMGELGSSQHNMCSCSVTCVGDVLLVATGNGVDESHINLPAPNAPSFFAMDRNTKKLLWTDKSPGTAILHGQWSSPTFAVLGGKPQALFAGGDGWLYSFDPQGDGKGNAKLWWKFDCNPKESKWILGGRGTRNNIIATPVIYDGMIYCAVGQDPEHGEGVGHLWCIDPTKSGDVSPELAVDADGKPLPHRRLQAVIASDGEKAIPNPNSAVVWHYSKTGPDFEQTMHRSCGTVAIKNDLLYIADFSGLFHCLDAKTGKPHWTYDMFAASWGSPLIVEDKVYIGDEDGDVAIFKLSAKQEMLGEINMGNAVYSTPIAANNVIYISNKDTLFAISADGK